MHTSLFPRIVTAFVLMIFVGATSAQSQDKSQPRQVARLMTIGIDGSDPRVVCEASGIQAPNWSPDSKCFAYVDYSLPRDETLK